MQTKTIIYWAIILLTLFIQSCQKAPINGDLDGQWQIMEVSPKPTETIINERLYYCFYMHSCMLTYYGGGVTSGTFIYDKKTIVLTFPYAQADITKQQLKQYGIYSNPVTFTIDYLDNKKLILRDGETVVTLRKF